MVKEMDKLIDEANLNIDKADLSLYKKIPESKHYGTLRGSYVRKEIADDIGLAGEFANADSGFAKSVLGDNGVVTKATKLWKMSKVALNPPTQMRNAISNMILLNLSGVRWRDLPKRLFQAWDDLRKDGVYTQIAKKYGVVNSTFSKQEMIEINKQCDKHVISNAGYALLHASSGISYIGARVAYMYHTWYDFRSSKFIHMNYSKWNYVLNEAQTILRDMYI